MFNEKAWREIQDNFSSPRKGPLKKVFYTNPEGGHYSSWVIGDKRVSQEKCIEVWTCPIEEVPLYINTVYAPLAEKRLKSVSV